MEVRDYVLLRNLLRVLVSQQQYICGGGSIVNFRVLPFRVKTQGLTLIGCDRQ